MVCVRGAERCDADRIELRATPQEGGLTPSHGVLVLVHKAIILPVHPIIRPRDGDFCYIGKEFVAMLNDICMVRELGFSGVMTDVLNADGQADIPRMKKIMAAARLLAVTFHRALDLHADPHQVRETLGGLGAKRILISDQQSPAEKGISLITELTAAGGTLTIMAGAGVCAVNLPLLLQAGVKEVHSPAGQWLLSEMHFYHPGASMSTDPDADEYRCYVVNGEAVAEMKGIISAWRS